MKKTDEIEIFQTVRADLQPYATLGFTNRLNSENGYDLWAEQKNVVNGHEVHELFFAGLKISGDTVILSLFPDDFPQHEKVSLRTLDEVKLNQLDDKIALAFKIFKENEWI